MDSKLNIKMYSFTLDCKEPNKLAKFYAQLMDWELGEFSEEYAYVYAKGTKMGEYPFVLFQRAP